MQRRNIGSRSFDIADFNRRCGETDAVKYSRQSAVLLGLGIFSSDRLFEFALLHPLQELGTHFIFSAA